MYRQWGGDIINMSVIPEAKLAREAELEYVPPILSVNVWLKSSYTLICTSTDYDAWRTGHAPVTVEEVVKTLHTNAGNARAIAAGLMQDVYDVVKEDKLLDEIKGSMRFACITRKEVSPQPKERNVLMIRSNPRLLGRSCLSSSPTSPTRSFLTPREDTVEEI
jgi:5'-methylthioadenosine phosphorylase